MAETQLEKIDKNFKIETNIEREGLTFYDVREAPFRLFGIMYADETFRRMPKDVGFTVNHGVGVQAAQTAGGRVRFVTDSPYIVLKAKIGRIRMSQMSLSGSSGFDLYVRENDRENYKKTFIPPVGVADEFDGVVDFGGERRERFITINFPLYNDVYELYIGLHETATLKEAPDYTINKPMVFYGSSITKGGCASRPGNTYQSFISRRYDCDFVNLGFAGNAKGEREMAEYIATLDMSAFIFDYDFNTPTLENLIATHEPFYKIVREAHPDIPILIMSRPIFSLDTEKDKRHLVIKETYDRAVASGDTKVAFIPGNELMALAEDNGTVDGTHPTDLGFFSMATRMFRELDVFFPKKFQ